MRDKTEGLIGKLNIQQGQKALDLIITCCWGLGYVSRKKQWQRLSTKKLIKP